MNNRSELDQSHHLSSRVPSFVLHVFTGTHRSRKPRRSSNTARKKGSIRVHMCSHTLLGVRALRLDVIDDERGVNTYVFAQSIERRPGWDVCSHRGEKVGVVDTFVGLWANPGWESWRKWCLFDEGRVAQAIGPGPRQWRSAQNMRKWLDMFFFQLLDLVFEVQASGLWQKDSQM
ncbi:hypothetical protein BDY19DRAFT_412057 [Irpex rosettiformis]|uniref:Uncharacterized protein n=1 Tax=Irpex rosettiformis TaxID=378272 RepID=A0ACB8UFP4_9APHY|nr:hypothetical protein BDY19DRAFT_412057 [Irpex rosettiformis]